MKLSSKLTLLLVVLVLAIVGGAGTASAWAPEGSAAIHPGVMAFTGGSSFLSGAAHCTPDFVLTHAPGGVYLRHAPPYPFTPGRHPTHRLHPDPLVLRTASL